jgi:hypothetical protein
MNQMRRTLLLTVVLVTFFLGLTLTSVRRWLVDSWSEPADLKVSVPPVDMRGSLTPLRIGIFIGVDGATLSADSKKFAFYEDYADRETLVPMSPVELRTVVDELRSAGLFEEAEFNAPSFISLPQTFTIVFAWPDEQRRFTWITRDECRVPEKYLQILERLNKNLKLPVIEEFIAANRLE